jgi:protein O-GlcNAc transferase
MCDDLLEATIARAFSHYRSGQVPDAEALCRGVLERQPRHAGAIHLLATMAHSQKRLRPALKLARLSVATGPGRWLHYNTLGIIFGDLGRWDECVAAFAQAIRLAPESFDAHRNLGVAFSKAGRLEDAVGPLTRAAELQPGEPEIWTLLASLHHGRLDLRAAIACRRRALALRPEDLQAHSDLLVTLHYSHDHSPEELHEEHVLWAKRHEDPVVRRAESDGEQLQTTHAEPPGAQGPAFRVSRYNPLRRLRIGYLSGDFRSHPMPRFFYPLLCGHNRARVTVHCYSDVACPDAQTRRMRGRADVWRDISALGDDAVAAQIRSDGIDVLVDLAGHLENRRLLVFARGPSPVQVSYIGYPNTTGMRTMHFRITDEYHDPRPSGAERLPASDSLHSERLIRLPGCCWAYDPGEEPAPPRVNELPASRAAGVTFVVFNRLIKVAPQMAQLWSRLLRRVPGSRLLVLDSTFAGAASVRQSFARLGFEDAEVGVAPRGGRAEYLARYGEADIALDTFPYAGMTTTCDAMWMGVPTVTLAGNTHVSRTGVSLLSAVGLPELIAGTPEEYVEIAVGLASDLPRLAALRAGLRERMRQSPLCDGQRLARSIEAAYREMWRKWCSGGG